MITTARKKLRDNGYPPLSLRTWLFLRVYFESTTTILRKTIILLIIEGELY